MKILVATRLTQGTYANDYPIRSISPASTAASLIRKSLVAVNSVSIVDSKVGQAIKDVIMGALK